MLDTNAVSAFLQRRSPRLDGWVREQRCCLSAIVVAEIRYGLEKRPTCSRVYGRLRAELERHGKPLAAMDLLIASHALSEGCVLVTADQAFALVDELTLEAW
ncbi:MAG: hypothetical protein NTW20_08585 [Rhodobacterales bacterium]|nr:hypothetical protein [Rhodobacterales bacterium]